MYYLGTRTVSLMGQKLIILYFCLKQLYLLNTERWPATQLLQIKYSFIFFVDSCNIFEIACLWLGLCKQCIHFQ